MKLLKYRVTNFRSVEDSGWIDVDDITVLIGTNESGKTNLLIPLWKLNPAGAGSINPMADYPRTAYHEIRAMENKPKFIEAHFRLDEALTEKIAKVSKHSAEELEIASVSRDLGGKYYIGFPNAQPQRNYPRESVVILLHAAKNEIETLSIAAQKEQPIKDAILDAINAQLENSDAPSSGDEDCLHRDAIQRLLTGLSTVDLSEASKNSSIRPRFEQLITSVEGIQAEVSRPHPSSIPEARKLVCDNLLSFVYYENYGNLDSQIYLPHVIANINRDGLGTKEDAKVRTLKVLFEFVKLQPEEILDLGRDDAADPDELTEEEISAASAMRTERFILLNSASSDLTARFRDWWKQGDYTFNFQADGDFFRIMVSDSQRPAPIELENRSTGLQWFFSFYLVFLVERTGAHENAMILLDEPGLTLHPLAQRELSKFFTNLAESNQIMYTAHSPFMVDPDHLDRVRSVYIDDSGKTAVSSDLRASEDEPAQSRSIYAVHAALGLSVSDTLLQGCKAVIVEGQSDQFYLSAIKLYLISKSLINPTQELLFMPAGGVKGVGAISTILTGHEESLPYVLLDADKPGTEKAKNLRNGLYQREKEKVLAIGDFVSKEDAEIEDLFPFTGLSETISRQLRGPEIDFDEVAEESRSIIPQVEDWAKQYGVELEKGWKVEVAKRAKARLEQGRITVPKETEEMWRQLFERLLSD